jgi:hypothetical protein
MRLAFYASVASVAAASAVSACSDDTTAAAGAPDASPSNEDGSPQDQDGSVGGGDDGKSEQDANGTGGAGAECAFNRDCQAALRCECDEATGCSCQPGVRGTGRNGIDACDSGNQCASALCVEGPKTDEFICSDECADPSDCTGKLPQCVPVFGIPAPICARDPE